MVAVCKKLPGPSRKIVLPLPLDQTNVHFLHEVSRSQAPAIKTKLSLTVLTEIPNIRNLDQ